MERRAGVAVNARAEWVVVDHSAHGIRSTQPRARVDTLVRRARLSLRAVCVEDAFRPTAGVRVALGESRKTLADGDGVVVVIVLGNAFSI